MTRDHEASRNDRLSVLKAAARAIRQMRSDLLELEQILDAELAGPLSDSLIERSCRAKRAYSSAESAGAAAAGRKVAGLRIYECPLCKAFHLTSRALDAFTGVER